jgi:hypothetical protein
MTGIAGGGHYSESGSGTSYLCLPHDTEGITFTRYDKRQKIGKPNNILIFGSKKIKGNN